MTGVRAGGGIWTLEDLAAYRVIERKPLVGEYRGARIVSASPPSSGGIALVDALNILSGYDLARHDPATRKHLVVEAMRRAFRDRAVYLGRSGFRARCRSRSSPSPDYAAGQRSSIRPDKAMPSDLLPGVETEPDGPAHHAFLDPGCATATAWRARSPSTCSSARATWSPETGVLLNDTMDDFSIKPGTPNAFGLVGNAANAIAPNKRSLSSMTPTFVETPKGVMIIGTPGGSYIISMVLLGTLDYLNGMSAADIVKDPRYHHQYLPDMVEYEKGALADGEIARLGHGPQARGGQPRAGATWR